MLLHPKLQTLLSIGLTIGWKSYLTLIGSSAKSERMLPEELLHWREIILQSRPWNSLVSKGLKEITERL
jgi:hypothetical protein